MNPTAIQILRDALEEIAANEFMLMAHAKALAALAAADAIPDAPVECPGCNDQCQKCRDEQPVPSRAELIELIVRQWNRFPADVHDNEAAARVLDALIKAGAVRA